MRIINKILLLTIILSSSYSAFSQNLTLVTGLWEPFKMDSNGTTVGLDIDIIDALQKETGLVITVERAPWAECYSRMEDGSADMMIGLLYNNEATRYIEYIKKPYLILQPTFFSNTVSMDIDIYNRLYRYKIGYIKNRYYFNRFNSDEELTKVLGKNDEELIDMLKAEDIDIIAGTDIQMKYKLKQMNLLDSITPTLYTPEENKKLYIGLSKKSGASENRKLIENAIKKLIRDEVIESITKKYTKKD